MSTKVKEGSAGTEFELPEPGSYPAYCRSLTIIGTIDKEYQGKVSKKPIIRIGWELPTERAKFGEDEEEKPYVVEKEFTNSSNPKGNLFKWLTTWSSKLNKDNFHKLDLADILGKPCMISISQYESKNGKTYLNADGISAVPKAIDVKTLPKQYNPNFIFDVEEFDQEKFNTLPKFIRDMIVSSEEFKESGLDANEVDAAAAEARGETTSEDNGSSAKQAEKDIAGDANSSTGSSNESFF
jgi:hypothetical protein